MQVARFNKELPEHVTPKKAFKSSGKMKQKFYNQAMYPLHVELVKLQQCVVKHNKRILLIFEGMDTAGKSSSIKALNAHLNPREVWQISLPKPTEREREQWYFQRHIKAFPNAGEMVFFDRSWYNRAGIEKVFSFCTDEEHTLFYEQVNPFEKMIIEDDILLFKFYFNISKKTQASRIKDRENNLLKSWKLTQLDYDSHKAYERYEALREKMFTLSGTTHAPWVCFDANDKKRARLNVIRFLLDNIAYENKDTNLINGVDKEVVTLHKHKEKK